VPFTRRAIIEPNQSLLIDMARIQKSWKRMSPLIQRKYMISLIDHLTPFMPLKAWRN
jgi:hypothetical protein